MGTLLTREQVRRVDRIAMEEYGIGGLVLMENAGRNAAEIILDEIERRNSVGGSGRVNRVLVFCGTGNNGGDGFVVARHLTNCGVDVRIALTGEPERLSPDAAANHRICAAMDIPMTAARDAGIRPDDLVVDALLGTGFTGQVREPSASVIAEINAASNCGVIAIDVPSGLDCDTGEPASACIVADLTITFVASKVGFEAPRAGEFVGDIRVVDIGAPADIIKQVLAS